MSEPTVTILTEEQKARLTLEQKKERYRTLRAKLGKSRLLVSGVKGIHYLWADAGDKNEMARLDSIGYAVVREPNAKEVMAGKATAKIQANGLREDGTYQLGDVILVQCSDETYEFVQLDVHDRYEELRDGATRDFINEAERNAVPTFETSGRKG